MTRDACGYPGCINFREIDPERKTFISGIPYFCGLHENSFLLCAHSDCHDIMVYASTDEMPESWFCSAHHPENQPVPEDTPPDPAPVNSYGEYLGKCPRCDKDVRIGHEHLSYPGEERPYHSRCLVETLHERLQEPNRLAVPLKPGEHPKTTLKCAHEGCTAGRDYDVADQIPAHYWCEKHKMQAMIDATRCDFMSCNLQGRFTDPSLEGKFCEHHRRVMIDSNKEQAHREEIAALKKQIEEKDMLLEQVSHRLVAWRSFSTQMMIAGLTKLKSRIGDMADHQMKELEHHLRELLGDVTK